MELSLLNVNVMVEICWLQGVAPTTAATAFAASHGDTAAAEAMALGAMWHVDNRLVHVAPPMCTGVDACITEAASMNEVQNILECFTRSGLRSAAFMSHQLAMPPVLCAHSMVMARQTLFLSFLL